MGVRSDCRGGGNGGSKWTVLPSRRSSRVRLLRAEGTDGADEFGGVADHSGRFKHCSKA